jgi:hypothetical protein
MPESAAIFSSLNVPRVSLKQFLQIAIVKNWLLTRRTAIVNLRTMKILASVLQVVRVVVVD